MTYYLLTLYQQSSGPIRTSVDGVTSRRVPIVCREPGKQSELPHLPPTRPRRPSALPLLTLAQFHSSLTMSSSLFDGLHSDNVYSDLPQGRSRQSRAPSSRPRSSSRPRGPPSESAGAPSEAGGFLDDGGLSTEAASRRRGAAQRDDVERVLDPIGEGMVNTFAQFLDR